MQRPNESAAADCSEPGTLVFMERHMRLRAAAELKRSAAAMKSLAALAVLVLTAVVSFGTAAPELRIHEAVATSDKYVATTKYIPSYFYVSSAVLRTEKDGRKSWHLRYEPIKPSPRKDAWFIVVVEMNKSCGIIQEE